MSVKIAENEVKIQKQLEEACCFVLCSNDIEITAENLLIEYKTQSSVEKKFQQIKSPHFVNALYLNTPERIEALTYLILISMMILSVAEYVVRREMKSKGEKILGPGKVKMTQPTLWAILQVFNVGIAVNGRSTAEIVFWLLLPSNGLSAAESVDWLILKKLEKII